MDLAGAKGPKKLNEKLKRKKQLIGPWSTTIEE
jgi:hypothetical protein